MAERKYDRRKRWGGALAALALVLSAAGWALAAVPEKEPAQLEEEERAITGQALMEKLKIGWNLGNTFDAPAGETAWGNPVTTKELLETVKALGFDTIRIPVSWGAHLSPEHTIEPEFLERVAQVVQDALDAGLYVILNSHHDNDIYMPTPENQEAAGQYLEALWGQIACRFREVDHRLIFQTMNEPRVVGAAYEWEVDLRNEDCLAAMEVVNRLNQISLDAIRAAGGGNEDRFVIVSPYAAKAQAAVSSTFRLPEDKAQDRLIVSIHAYIPYGLCLDTRSPEDGFTPAHQGQIESLMKSIHYRFVREGIPVIIDEMGCLDKGNPQARYQWAKAFVAAAAERGIPCLWWDNGAVHTSGENFGLIDRRRLEVYEGSRTAYQGLMEGLAAAQGETPPVSQPEG